MLFEIRDTVPEVSQQWENTRDLFIAGRSREAWREAVALRKNKCLESANDYILNAEIARACSVNRTYFALIRMALQKYPDDPIVQLYHSRVLLTRGRFTSGIRFMLERESCLGATHRALWGTELANLYGNAGFDSSCKRWLEKVADEPGIDSPLALYTRACAFEGMQQWDEALRLSRKCVETAPDWSRARANLVHCLLARGQVEEAASEIAKGQKRGHEESLLDFSATMLAFSLGRFDEARTGLEAIQSNWPQADFLNWVRRTLCILLVEIGDCDAVRDVAMGQEKMLALPQIPSSLEGKRHKFIPLPLVSQNKNQCVPTSVAMAVYPQGRQLDPDLMFHEMRGREGTSLWRMREWVNDHGFELIPIRLEKSAIIALLDQGIPLIGILEGPFSSHVNVICGYNEDLEVLYVRDPGHWSPMAWPWDEALQRYEMHDGLLAIIDSNSDDVVAVAKPVVSDNCKALMDLSRAVSKGNRLMAEEANAKIPDDAKSSFMRDVYAIRVALSPKSFYERMQIIAGDEDANIVSRFRAMMNLGPADAQEILGQMLEKDGQGKFAQMAMRYLRLLECMNDGHWPRALSLVEDLLLCGGGVAQFWDIKSDILVELGNHDESIAALECAIELEPQRMMLRGKALYRSAARLTYAEYLQEYETLLANDPDDKSLLWGRSSTLYDGPDGKAYESAAREYIHWFPRDPDGYVGLMNWYNIQSRQDLRERTLNEARELLEDVFGSKDDADISDSSEATDDNNFEVSDEHGETSSQPEDNGLPKDKDQLLDRIWVVGDPLRGQALQRVFELEEDGQLKWYERARVLACRLLIEDEHTNLSEREAKERAKRLLPESVPGAPHWFAGAVSDIVTNCEPRVQVALAVNKWIDRVVPNIHSYPDLWFNRVLLLEKAHQMEKALAELEQMLKHYPAHSSALYRMGIVEYSQEDYPASRKFMERALEVNPGLPGAMHTLRDVHYILGNRDVALKYIRMLRKKMPYDFGIFQDEVMAVWEDQSADAAHDLLRSAEGEFCPQRIEILKAQLHLKNGSPVTADSHLSELSITPEEKDEDLYEYYLQTRMSVATENEDRTSILSICEEGLRRWPDSTRLKEILAEHLATEDSARSLQLLREVLLEGQPAASTAFQYLSMAGERADSAAQKIISEASEDKQENLAELFSEVTGHHTLLRWNEKYLEWASNKFPGRDVLQYRLMCHYDINGEENKALRLAEELYRRNPHHPEYARMMGRCMIGKDPMKALSYLEKACKQNRSADYLFDLARGYHVAGHSFRAGKLHWELLQQNPYLSSSCTALFLLQTSPEKLWPYVSPILERGIGVNDEYFLVTAVKIALSVREKLPKIWFPLAVERFTILKTHPGYNDERKCLKRALMAWLWVRPEDGRDVPGLPGFFGDSLVARFFWPRRAWIPEN